MCFTIFHCKTSNSRNILPKTTNVKLRVALEEKSTTDICTKFHHNPSDSYRNENKSQKCQFNGGSQVIMGEHTRVERALNYL